MPPQPPHDDGALDLGERDALTGLWNRRRFEQELDRARQNAERVALLSIDVDRYREVIRRHGAAAAQGLIQAIAHVLAERLRPNDTLARMGGDEFAAVFHATTPPLIQSLADGLCTAVREQTPATGTSPIPATISIGAAFFDPAPKPTTKRSSPPKPPSTRPRSQAATAPSCTSPRNTPSTAPQ